MDEPVSYIRAVFALLFVLGLIGMAAYAARRFGLNGPIKALCKQDRRLSVEEIYPLDGRHRLVLVRRDDTEHLLMLGSTSDLLIESNIKPKKKERA